MTLSTDSETLLSDGDHHDADGADSNSRAVGIAFAITIVAGLATAVGGAVVFFPQLTNTNNDKRLKEKRKLLLSAGLALAAGCITYLAFVDLLSESSEFFVSDLTEENSNLSSLMATICFFSGICLMYILSYITRKISPNTPHCHATSPSNANDVVAAAANISGNNPINKDDTNSNITNVDEMGNINEKAPSKVDGTEGDVVTITHHSASENKDDDREDAEIGNSVSAEYNDNEEKEEINNVKDDVTDTDSIFGGSNSVTEEEQRGLWKSGIATAIALILHNLPEGMITFVTSQSNPTIGVALAIGIALHNIPEGICVALPIYFATGGNKWKAFFIAFVTGLAPILGALIAYVILETRNFSNTTFGVMFAMASGMLVYIALKHLLRTAYKYDPKDTVTTNCFIVGMALIAIATVVLDATGNHSHGLEDGDHHSHHSTSEVSIEEKTDETITTHDGDDETSHTANETSSNHDHDDGDHDHI